MDHPPQLTGREGVTRLWIRSALAPPLWSRWSAVGIAGIAAIAAVEVVLGAHAALGSAFAVVALGIGLAGGRGDAIAVAVAALAAAAVSGLLATWDAPWTVTIVVVGAASVTATLVALLRATAATTRRQLQLLRELARLALSSRDIEQLTDSLLDVIVPAYADAAMLDLAIVDYERRVRARVAGPAGGEIAEWVRRRPPPVAGLPEAQRAITTGHPALIEDIDDELLRRMAADDDDLARLRQLGARSLLTLPLAARSAPLGALSLLVGPSGRRYTRADLEFAQLVQGRMAMVLDNTGLSRAAARSEALVGAALDTLEEAVTMNGPDGRTVYVNQAAVRLLHAASAEELVHARPGEISERFDVYDEAGEPVGYQQLPAFRAIAGEEHPEALLVRNVVRATGEERWLLNKVSVLRDADGAVDRIVNVIEDVTQVKQAEVRQRLLAEAARILSGPADEQHTLGGLAAALVPALAEWCVVDVPDRAEPVARAGEAGRAAAGELVAGVLADGVTRQATSESGAVLVVGLRGGGSPLGAISLGRARAFSAEDVRLAEELGNRAGVAVLNARLSQERAAIARELQQGLRPPALPAVPGLETATLYRPAGELNDVGGDFYDAFPIAGGWTVCIGDVAGQGARAAALTGIARVTLRSVAQHSGDHGEAVAAVNRALAEQPEMALCTLAVLCLLRTEDDTVALASLSSGHPLPILVRGGVAQEVGVPGPIAGVFDEATWETTVTPLADGDTIVLYTDGVLDTVGADERFGEERLLALLHGVPADPAALVARIDEALASFQAGPQRDDTAIVALTVRDVRALAGAVAPARATA